MCVAEFSLALLSNLLHHSGLLSMNVCSVLYTLTCLTGQASVRKPAVSTNICIKSILIVLSDYKYLCVDRCAALCLLLKVHWMLAAQCLFQCPLFSLCCDCVSSG